MGSANSQHLNIKTESDRDTVTLLKMVAITMTSQST